MRYLIVLLVAGCASVQTPAEIERQGPRLDATSARSVREAAACVHRNAEEYRFGVGGVGGGAPATMREGRTPGTVEITMHNIAFARIEPRGAGSAITVWTSDLFLYGMAELPAAMVKGC
jgi:hypothetical protein